MKITICGSIAFYDEMLSIKKDLEKLGHEIKIPPAELQDQNGKTISVKEFYQQRKGEIKDQDWITDIKEFAIRLHFEKIENSDAVLILNYDKNNISNYIGANTFLELGLAFHLKKKLFLLNAIPEGNYSEEIRGMKPIVINGILKSIK